MKIKERQGAKAGSYQNLKFSSLIRKGNKVGLSKSDKGDRLMFRLKSGDTEVPYSVVWDFENSSFCSTVGALGVPAPYLKKLYEQDGLEATLLKFEGLAKEKGLPVSIYVREDGGWGSAIKPSGANVYTAKFIGILSRDEEGTLSWELVPASKVKSKKGGGMYDAPEWKKIRVGLEIVAGERKGTVLSYQLAYSIVKDPDDNWIVDADSVRGAEFYNFLLLHKVAVSDINPDRDFENPENGCPELSETMLKHQAPLSVSFNAEGWVSKVEKLPDGVVVAETQIDEGTLYASEGITKLFSLMDKKTRLAESTTAWASDGQLSDAGKKWFAKVVLPFMKQNDMPLNFKKLTEPQVQAIITYINNSI